VVKDSQFGTDARMIVGHGYGLGSTAYLGLKSICRRSIHLSKGTLGYRIVNGIINPPVPSLSKRLVPLVAVPCHAMPDMLCYAFPTPCYIDLLPNITARAANVIQFLAILVEYAVI